MLAILRENATAPSSLSEAARFGVECRACELMRERPDVTAQIHGALARFRSGEISAGDAWQALDGLTDIDY